MPSACFSSSEGSQDESAAAAVSTAVRSKRAPLKRKAESSSKTEQQSGDVDVDAQICAYLNRPRQQCDEDELWLRSLKGDLGSLSPQTKARTKLRIQNILFEARFPQSRQGSSYSDYRNEDGTGTLVYLAMLTNNQAYPH